MLVLHGGKRNRIPHLSLNASLAEGQQPRVGKARLSLEPPSPVGPQWPKRSNWEHHETPARHSGDIATLEQVERNPIANRVQRQPLKPSSIIARREPHPAEGGAHLLDLAKGKGGREQKPATRSGSAPCRNHWPDGEGHVPSPRVRIVESRSTPILSAFPSSGGRALRWAPAEESLILPGWDDPEGDLAVGP